jgi:hypothetical protein
MRRKFAALTFLLCMLGMLSVNMPAPLSVDSPSIVVLPSSTVDPSLTVGMLYTVSIYTDYAGWDVTSYQFTLSYDPTIFEGIAAVNGDLIVGGSAQFKSGKFNDTSGELSLTVGFYFAEGEVTSGPGTLAEVIFRVIGIGPSDIELGPETKLIGWDWWAWPPTEYDIIDAATMPTHIEDGSFDNTGAVAYPPYPPVASIVGDAGGFTGEVASFSGAGSYDPDLTAIVSYDWTFGDGTTGTGVAPSHTYSVAGNYKVALRVTDAQSQVSAEATHTISVEDRIPFKANLVDKKAWPEKHLHDLSKHGDINVITAKVVNNGSSPVQLKVVFYIYDARRGAIIDTLETAEITLAPLDSTQLLTVDFNASDPTYGIPKYVVFIRAKCWFGETTPERPGQTTKTIRVAVVE